MSNKPTQPKQAPKEMSLEEAMAEIKQLQEANAEKERKILAQEAELEAFTADQEGWLIRTPSPAYDGRTYEVEFKDGLGFVPRSARYERFSKVEKDTRRKLYSDEEWKALKEREKATPAERMVNALVTQFGYEADFFPRDRLQELKKIREQRKSERAQFELEAKANNPAKVSQIVPAYFNR
jgi:hypothetical protein